MSSNDGISSVGPVDEIPELKGNVSPKGPMLLSERPTLVRVSGNKVPVTAPGAPAAPFTKILQLLMTGLAVLSLLLIACILAWQSHHPQSDGYSFSNPKYPRVRTVATDAREVRPVPLPPNFGNLPVRHLLPQPRHLLHSNHRRTDKIGSNSGGAIVTTAKP